MLRIRKIISKWPWIGLSLSNASRVCKTFLFRQIGEESKYGMQFETPRIHRPRKMSNRKSDDVHFEIKELNYQQNDCLVIIQP